MERVQAWRVEHPGYSRSKPRKARTQPALQEALIPQVTDLIEESSIRAEIAEAPALQEAWDTASPLLAGLIVHLFELTLQDAMPDAA